MLSTLSVLLLLNLVKTSLCTEDGNSTSIEGNWLYDNDIVVYDIDIGCFFIVYMWKLDLDVKGDGAMSSSKNCPNLHPSEGSPSSMPSVNDGVLLFKALKQIKEMKYSGSGVGFSN